MALKQSNFSILSLLFLSFLLISCKSQKVIEDNSCKGKTEIHTEWLEKENETANHVVVKNPPDYFAINFVGDFNNDSFSIFVNNKLHSNLNIEEPEEDKAKYVVVISRRIYPEIPLLRIESVKLKKCFDIKLDAKHPLVYIWLDNDKWIVKYTNFYNSDNKKPISQ